MVQETALRLASGPDIAFSAPQIICAEGHLDTVRDQLAKVGVSLARAVLEPFGRNTAAAALVAGLMVKESDPDGLCLLLPADHVIADVAAFRAALIRAEPMARSSIVTFGIDPTGPETGYGYIQRGVPVGPGLYSVRRFAEKPDLATARTFLATGEYSWNAGIFLFAPEVMIEEMQRHAPDIARAAEAAYKEARREDGVVHLDAGRFADCPSQPVDVAVMEKTGRAVVAPCSIGWADLGSWGEIWRLNPKDDRGVFIKGPAVTRDVSDSLVWSEGPPVAVIGVSGLVVVATRDGVLVTSKERSQEVRAALNALRNKGVIS